MCLGGEIGRRMGINIPLSKERAGSTQPKAPYIKERFHFSVNALFLPKIGSLLTHV